MPWTRKYPPLTDRDREEIEALWMAKQTPTQIVRVLAARGTITSTRAVWRMADKWGLPKMRKPGHARTANQERWSNQPPRRSLALCDIMLQRALEKEEREIAQKPHNRGHLCTGRFCLICGGLG